MGGRRQREGLPAAPNRPTAGQTVPAWGPRRLVSWKVSELMTTLHFSAPGFSPTLEMAACAMSPLNRGLRLRTQLSLSSRPAHSNPKNHFLREALPRGSRPRSRLCPCWPPSPACGPYRCYQPPLLGKHPPAPCPQLEPQGGGCQAGGAVEEGLSAPRESRGQGRQHWWGLQTPGS